MVYTHVYVPVYTSILMMYPLYTSIQAGNSPNYFSLLTLLKFHCLTVNLSSITLNFAVTSVFTTYIIVCTVTQ